MIEVTLYCDGGHHLDVHAQKPKTADREITRLLNGIAKGEYGSGRFVVDAMYVDDIGAWLGNHFYSGPLVYLAKPVAESVQTAA